MTVTIGRVGSDGINLDDPELSFSGDQVTMSGIYTPAAGSSTAVVDGLWLRDQILGLAGNDGEPVVPVRWSTRAEFGDELDGFYRVVDAQATLGTAALHPDAPSVPWGLTLQRAKDYRQPRMEVFGAYSLVANGFALTQFHVIVGIPKAALDRDPGIPPAMGTRTTPDGDVSFAVLTASTSGTYLAKFSLQPAYWYVGGCRAQFDVGSGDWRTIIGRRAVTSLEAGNQQLRIDNGLVRVTPSGTNIAVQWFNGTAWSTSINFLPYEHSTPKQVRMYSGTVLRQSPEEITVRMSGTWDGLPEYGPVTVDLTLRRGSYWVYCKITSTRQGQWEIRFPTTVACTDVLTGGSGGAIRRTSNNSNGNRELLAANTYSADLVNGRIYQTTATNTEWTFGIGIELGGSGAVGTDNEATNQKLEWFSAQSETMRVVAA